MSLPAAPMRGDLAALALMLAVLVPVVIIDVRERRIPDVLVIPAIAGCALLRAVLGVGWALPLAWAAAAAGCLLVPALIRPDGMGMGDVKLAALLGACLGPLALPAVVVALVTGAVAGGAWAAARRVPMRAATIPFAPFLAIGAFVVALPWALIH